MRIATSSVALSMSLALPVLAMGQLLPETEPQTEREPRPVTASDSCDSAAYAHLVGRPSTEVEALSFEQPVRIIPRGAAVTMDYIARRINFELDGAGNVSRIYCG